MTTKILFILCMFISIPAKAQNEVERIVVYKRFCRGATTIGALHMFKHPQMPIVDTTNINTGANKFLNEFGMILSQSKRKKHYQQKITGIDVAGEFWFNQSDKHFFIICLPNLLIDITDKKEYRINDDFLLKQIQNWIEKLKSK